MYDRWRLSFVVFAFWLLAFASSFAQTQDAPLLPADKAFPAQAEATQEAVRFTWSIAAGYYLYASKFRFQTSTPGVVLGKPQLPQGQLIQDPFFGELEIFRDQVTVTVPVAKQGPPVEVIEIKATSQGCADRGVCYPPHSATHRVAMSGRKQVEAAKAPRNDPVAALAALAAILGGGKPENEFLDVDEAFVLDWQVLTDQSLRIGWTIADGYYLYRDKFQFVLMDRAGVELGDIEIPAGQVERDKFFGTVEVLRHAVQATIGLQRSEPAATALVLEVGYQGCADAGLCYPPTTKRVAFNLPSTETEAVSDGLAEDAERATESEPPSVAPVAAAGKPASPPAAGEGKLSEQDRIARSLALGNLWLVLMTFFAFGLLLAFTPCVFPMVPILSGIIAGQGEQITARRAFVLSLVYVLAVAFTYTLAGVIAGLFGHNLQATFQDPWLLVAFSAVFVLLALSMFGFYELQLPSSWQSWLARFSNRQRRGTLLGVAIMGLLSALIVGPCVAPPLAGALIYISQSGDALLGGSALFALSLGMGVPLLVIGTSAGKLLPRAGVWMNTVKHVFGVLLLAVAIYLIERIIPGWVAMLLWAVLFIVVAIYIGALDYLQPGVSGWRRFWKGTGLVMLVYGVLLMVGAASGGDNVLRPLKNVALMSAGVGASQPLAFKHVKGLEEVQAEIQAASTVGRPVVLDYYADWCVSCKEMEKYTFSDPGVQAALAKAVLLKTDVTANDPQDRALLKHFGLFGPPAILFFGPDGAELTGYRVVGFVNAEAFRAHVLEALG
ncbi:MAG: protein-disulfide reductase DsbD [Gammaproteobacteria bacterium]